MKALSTTEVRRRPQSGFTLVELTIVMVIVGLLLGALMMPLSMQMETRRYADTKKTMDDIKEALIGFALANGRLPCPADPTKADGQTGAGLEQTSCTTATQVGVIPWVTLNVPETDEWGGRFKYRVTYQFADTIGTTVQLSSECGSPVPTPSAASFALCAWGDMRIQSRTTTKTAYDMTNANAAVPAVFISHGKNGYGAYGTNGTLIAAVPASNTDEAANAAVGTTIFFSREKTDTSSGCSDAPGPGSMCEFDDLVAFVPLTTLMNRMVVSGKLP